MASVQKYTSPVEYRNGVYPNLLQNEAENCLGIGVVDTLINTPDRYPIFHLGAIKSDERDSILGAVWFTPPHPLGITRLADANIEAVVDFALNLPQKPGSVVGPAETVETFKNLWTNATGSSVVSCIKQGIYKLIKVESTSRSIGGMCLVDQDDKDRLVDWNLDFTKTCGLGDDLTKAKEYAASAIKYKTRFFWEVGGKVVSMAGVGGNTPNGIRISWVYTPPALRGNGYASALVAELSQLQLDSGKNFCFLYTDLANPTSNRIYQRIGYKMVSESAQYNFSG